MLTTLEDAENEKLRAMEEAAWYNDEFGEHMVDSSKKEKNIYANMEALDDLHCNHSHNLIHQKKGNQPVASEGETFQDGSRMKPVVVESGDDEETDYKNLFAAELIALLKKHKISPKGTVGSPPNLERSSSRRSAEGEDSSSHSSSVSSSSSGIESVTMKATSPPSDGGGTAACKPCHGE